MSDMPKMGVLVVIGHPVIESQWFPTTRGAYDWLSARLPIINPKPFAWGLYEVSYLDGPGGV